MRTAYPRDKEAQIAKILLWLALLCLYLPIIFGVISSPSVLEVVLALLFWLVWILIWGPSIFILLLFMLCSYRTRAHIHSFLFFSLLTLAGQFIMVLIWAATPLSYFQVGIVALWVLPLVWILCRWVKLPAWLLRILHTIPGVMLILATVSNPSLLVFWWFTISHILYCAACVLIIPSIVRTTQKNLN